MPTLAEVAEFAAGCDQHDEVIVIHNAADLEPVGLVGELDTDEVRHAVATNVLALMLLTNTVLRAVPTPHRLRFLYVTSAAMYRPYPGWATYYATQVAAETFLRCAAAAATRRCTVDVIDPGAVADGRHGTISRTDRALPRQDQRSQRFSARLICDDAVVARQIVIDYLAGPIVTDT